MKKKKWMPILLSISVLSSMGISYAAQTEAPTGEQAQKIAQTSEITGTITVKDDRWMDVFFNEEYKEEELKTVSSADLISGSYDNVLVEETGSGFVIPDSWKDVSIALSYSVPADNQMEVFVLQTADVTKLNELGKESSDGTANADEVNTAYLAAMDHAFRIFGIYSREADGQTDSGLFSDSEFGARFAYAEKIGVFADREYYFVYNDVPPSDGFTDEETAEIRNILDSMDAVRGNVVLFPPQEISQEEFSGIDLSNFETVDLNGNTVTQDIFKDYDITMINIWATWCGPCRSELPEIQAAYEKLPENANIISICHDAADDTEIANAIVEKMGMEFAVLVPNEELDQSVFTYLTAFPTTVFVDKEGHMVGDAVIGVPAADDVTQAYLDYIDAALER